MWRETLPVTSSYVGHRPVILTKQTLGIRIRINSFSLITKKDLNPKIKS